MNKKFFATAFTLSGTIMGAGILGLPYVFAKSGFFVGVFWLIVIGIVLTFVNLCLGEITLRTKGHHQLTGYAKKYLGRLGGGVMFFGMVFGVYSALLAYLIGEGESFSRVLPGNINPFILGFLFWLIMTFLLREGLDGLKKIGTYGVLAVFVMIFGMFIFLFPQIEYSNLTTFHSSNFTLPIGIVLFALLGFTSIPELREEIRGNEKLFKKAIILGSVLPVVLYIIFSLTFVGVLGIDVNEVATLSFGPLVSLLGIFTMSTSYFVLSFSLRDMFKYDLGISRKYNFLLTSILPLLIYTLVYFFNLSRFSLILGIGGVVSGGVTSVMILLVNKYSKKKTRNGKKPEIFMPLNWIIISFFVILFTLGIFFEFFH